MPCGLERVDERAQVLLQHVVAEVHDEVVVAEEVARDQHAVREAERCVLRDVGDLDAEPASRRRPRLAISASRVVADDDADLA